MVKGAAHGNKQKFIFLLIWYISCHRSSSASTAKVCQGVGGLYEPQGPPEVSFWQGLVASPGTPVADGCPESWKEVMFSSAVSSSCVSLGHMLSPFSFLRARKNFSSK